jgi:hypothetical protein
MVLFWNSVREFSQSFKGGSPWDVLCMGMRRQADLVAVRAGLTAPQLQVELF